jgi:hypothetical protein
MLDPLGALLLLYMTSLVPPASQPATGMRAIRPGMTATQLGQLICKPPRQVSRQLLFHHYLEQRIFDDPPLRVTLDCLKGQDPRVLAVHSKEAGGR